jgi:hypothetical protein
MKRPHIVVRSTLARDPNTTDTYNASHPVHQQFGPFEYVDECRADVEDCLFLAVLKVETLFALVMLPGESLTLEAEVVS